MTKADVIESVCKEVGFSKKESAEIVEMVFDTIKDTLEKGEKIKLSGFGNFVVREKRSRVGRNPQTGQEIEITRRALISISWPVWGLRPTRERFSRTTKLPKPESLIFSPFSSVSLMVSNTISTISALSFLENPTSLHTLSITSALVMERTIVDRQGRVKATG